MNGHTSNNVLRAALMSMYQTSLRRAKERDAIGDKRGDDFYAGRADAAAVLAIDLGIIKARAELAE
jgi:hypothetical protein